MGQELRVFERRAEEIRKHQEAPTTARNLTPNSTNEHARAAAQQQREKEEQQEATARRVRDARAREEMAEREDGERQRADHEREEIRREGSESKWQESAEQGRTEHARGEREGSEQERTSRGEGEEGSGEVSSDGISPVVKPARGGVDGDAAPQSCEKDAPEPPQTYEETEGVCGDWLSTEYADEDEDGPENESGSEERDKYAPANYVIGDADDAVIARLAGLSEDMEDAAQSSGDTDFMRGGSGDTSASGRAGGDEFSATPSNTVRGKISAGSKDSAPERKRSEQKCASKSRTIQRAKLALKAEQVGARTWKPRQCVGIIPEVGIQLEFRWQCE